MIASSQLFHLLGIESHGAGFFSRIGYLAGHLGSTHVPSALVGIGALAALLVLEKRLAGGRSARSLVFTAASVAIVLLVLTGPFRYLPEPVLAALVLAAVAGLVERQSFRHLRRVNRLEFRAAFPALLGVLVFGILRGVVLAVAVTLLMVIARTAKTSASLRGRRPGATEFVDLVRYPDARPVSGVLVYRPDEGLVYFNADHLREDALARVRAEGARPELVVLDLSQSVNLDLSSVNMLCELSGAVRPVQGGRRGGVDRRNPRLRAAEQLTSRLPAARSLTRAGFRPSPHRRGTV